MAHELNHELRHIRASHLDHLSIIIDEAKAWTDLLKQMSSEQFQSFSITLESAHLIKRQLSCDKSPTSALLNHWAITGRVRPTILDLIILLRSCNLRRAEAFVWNEVLRVSFQTDQLPNEQVNQAVKVEESFQVNSEFHFKDLSPVLSNITRECSRFDFKSIYESSDHFCHHLFNYSTNLGSRIGDGRFSSVFLAKVLFDTSSLQNKQDQQVPKSVAAKLLKSECNIDYLVNEINLAKQIKHENIIELLGISVGNNRHNVPTYICLIYPFMPNGSLLDCLGSGLRCSNHIPITWQSRVEISVKIAKAIHYLHNFPTGVLIHRDIKTANILIDEDLEPKLGDFTLVRQLDSMKNGETQYSQNIIGTGVYMPPEAFRGDISTKFDIFSFGVVILELLTGLKPFNDEINEDLLTNINDRLSDLEDLVLKVDSDIMQKRRDEFLLSIIDKNAGQWSFRVAKTMFALALKATEVRKRDRPEVVDVLATLEESLEIKH